MSLALSLSLSACVVEVEKKAAEPKESQQEPQKGPNNDAKSDKDAKSDDDAIIHENEAIMADTTWKGHHIVSHFVTVENATLTIEPGTIIKMDNAAEISLKNNGRIIADGQESKEIIFTSRNNYPLAGDWRSIKFYSNAANGGKFNHTRFEYGDNAVYVDGSSLSIDNCTFMQPEHAGIVLSKEGGSPSIFFHLKTIFSPLWVMQQLSKHTPVSSAS